MIFFLQTWNYYYSKHTEIYKNKISKEFPPHTEDSTYMFDAIWTAALALNKTKSRLEEKHLTFMNFTYGDKIGREISNIIYEEALKANFFGLTVSL